MPSGTSECRSIDTLSLLPAPENVFFFFFEEEEGEDDGDGERANVTPFSRARTRNTPTTYAAQCVEGSLA